MQQDTMQLDTMQQDTMQLDTMQQDTAQQGTTQSRKVKKIARQPPLSPEEIQKKLFSHLASEMKIMEDTYFNRLRPGPGVWDWEVFEHAKLDHEKRVMMEKIVETCEALNYTAKKFITTWFV